MKLLKTRVTRWLVVCAVATVLLGAMLTQGHKLQHTDNRRLRVIGRWVLGVRMRVGLGTVHDLVESVSAAVGKPGDGLERREAFDKIVEMRYALDPAERERFSEGVQDLFGKAASDVEAVLLLVYLPDEFPDRFLLSALYAQNTHARRMAANELDSRMGGIAAEEIAEALEKCLSIGLERGDTSMLVDAMDNAVFLRSTHFFVSEQETLVQLSRDENELVRTSAMRCLWFVEHRGNGQSGGQGTE